MIRYLALRWARIAEPAVRDTQPIPLVIDLVDLPGTYTLQSGSPAELEASRYLDSQNVDVIINVADSTQLASALSLTLELAALNKPLILALNMVDEAARLYDAGKEVGPEANMAKLLAADASSAIRRR